MTSMRLVLVAFACLLMAIPANAQDGKVDPAKVDALVRKLGSSAFVQREQARRELEAIGVPALETLRKAVKVADLETARRLTDLIRILEEQAQTREILAPKMVSLDLKNATVEQAIAELTKASGYPIHVYGDATKHAEKRITLKTDKVPFWDAFDRICASADLMERVDLTPPVLTNIYYNRGGIRGLQRMRPAPTINPAGPIALTNRNGEKSITSNAGSVRTELRVARDAEKKELVLTFIASAEPKMANNGIFGKAILDKAVDSKGRVLAEVVEIKPFKAPEPGEAMPDGPDTVNLPLRQFSQIRIKDDHKAAESIKEIAGRLSYQLDMQNEILARMDNVMKSAGKSVATTIGGTMKVNAVSKVDGKIQIDVSLENTVPNPYAENIAINGRGGVVIRGNANIRKLVIGPGGVVVEAADENTGDLPVLVDRKGEKFSLARIVSDNYNLVNGPCSRFVTMQFHPNANQAEPHELILYGTRTHTIVVPFRFENVPLP